MTSDASTDAPVAIGTERNVWHIVAATLGRRRGVLTFLIGLGLVLGAVWAVLGDADTLETALRNFRAASPWLVAAAVVLPAANMAVVSVAFWSLTRRFGAVGVGEMSALVTGAWLLNHLPMRAGMVGRLTYHKVVNRIPLRASVRVVIEGVVLSVGAIIASLVLAWLIEVRGAGWSSATNALVLAIPLVVASLVQVLVPGLWAWTMAFLCRYIDALLWAARYAVVFAVVGAPIGYVEALFFGGITQVVGMVPIAGNGLGVREWTVGVTAAVFGAASETTGIAADLVNRGAELLVGVPMGLIATAWVGRRVARYRRGFKEHGSTHGVAGVIGDGGVMGRGGAASEDSLVGGSSAIRPAANRPNDPTPPGGY